MREDRSPQRNLLHRIPAAALGYHVEPAYLSSLLHRLDRSVSVAEIAQGSDRVPRRLADREASEALRPAISLFDRALTRPAHMVPRRSEFGWVIPAEVVAVLEGRSDDSAKRRGHFERYLHTVRQNRAIDSKLRAAVGRFHEATPSTAHVPHWVYWLSGVSVDLVRRLSPSALLELNRACYGAVENVNGESSIRDWQRSLDLFTRRLPLGLVVQVAPRGRLPGYVTKADRAGLDCLGALSVLSVDCQAFLRRLRIPTLLDTRRALLEHHRSLKL